MITSSRIRYWLFIFCCAWAVGCIAESAEEVESNKIKGDDGKADFWDVFSSFSCRSTPSYQSCDRRGTLELLGEVSTPREYRLGEFIVQWQGNDERQPLIRVTHAADRDKVIWSTVPGRNFLAVGRGEEEVHERRGSLIIKDHLSQYCTDQRVVAVLHDTARVAVVGDFGTQCPASYALSFDAAGDRKLDFSVSVVSAEGDQDNPFDRSYLIYASSPEEHFFGFGMQFSHLDLKGRRVPIIIQEQGVGRGLPLVSAAVELTQGRGVSGAWHTSYGAVPHYMTSAGRSLFLKNTEYSVFDLTRDDEVQVELFSANVSGQLLAGSTPLEQLSLFTDYAGRMRALPAWTQQGAIIGMQGGTGRVYQVLDQLDEAGVPLAAFWLQDWVGQRSTSFGSQLWWNWALDEEHYPGWHDMVAELAERDVRVMSYLNPFLADVEEKGPDTRNLFREAESAEYLVTTETGEPYMIQNTSFSAALLDLTLPEAQRWIKDIIRTEVLASGVSGWMADFGEALPFEAHLASGVPAADYHNQYAADWARLNREAIVEAGREEDVIFFSRSAFTTSPGYSRLFWLGDQLVTWDDKDGLKTAVTGLLTSGISGFSLNHSDIGGYTTITSWLFDRHRSKELLLRWAELNAFTAVFRSHEGNRPGDNHQVYSDDDTLAQFARAARIYAALAPYRQELMVEAEHYGYPLARALWLHYPDDVETYGLRHQFLLGPDLLVAPVLDEGQQEVDFYLPQGQWEHVWTGTVLTQGWHRVRAPLGEPAIFVRCGSVRAEELTEALLETVLP
jgi:alpha-glucosidase